MLTPTWSVAGALPATPLTAIGEVTAGPASGMATSAPLLNDGPAGGGVVPPVPVDSSRFGEPVPGLPTTFGVALATSASRTCCAVAPVWSARYSAAAPATCGVAIEVPLIVFVAVSLV